LRVGVALQADDRGPKIHLPVIVHPSHAAVRRDLVTPIALAAIAAGADGLLVEIHPEPDQARSDGDQSLLELRPQDGQAFQPDRLSPPDSGVVRSLLEG